MGFVEYALEIFANFLTGLLRLSFNRD